MAVLNALLRPQVRSTIRGQFAAGSNGVFYSCPWRRSQRARFTVLGIESSADDAGVALLEKYGPSEWKLLANERVSAENVNHGGIHPVEARQSHTRHLSRMVHTAMQSLPLASPGVSSMKQLLPGQIMVSSAEAADSTRRGLPFGPTSPSPRAYHLFTKPDLIAVTHGPGMGGCLSIGVTTAKALSVAWQVPIVGVHHMQAHALTALMQSSLRDDSSPLTPRAPEDEVRYPFLTLLVSGKHTMLVHTKSAVNHRILVTVESGIALGDVLDKFARELVPKSVIPPGAKTVVYPRLMEDFVGPGPRLAYTASATRRREHEVYRSEHGWEIPSPLRENRTRAYNFSSLNGWLHRFLQARRGDAAFTDERRRDLAFDVMRIAFEHVMSRVVMVLEEDEELRAAPPGHLVLSGGVASNLLLRTIARRTLDARRFPDVRVATPDPKWCTDNAAMIAFAGAQMFLGGWETDAAFAPLSAWSIEELLTGVDSWRRRPGVVMPEGMKTDAATARRLREADEGEAPASASTSASALVSNSTQHKPDSGGGFARAVSQNGPVSGTADSEVQRGTGDRHTPTSHEASTCRMAVP